MLGLALQKRGTLSAGSFLKHPEHLTGTHNSADFHELGNGAEFHHLLGMGFMPTEEAEHHTLQAMF